MQAQWYRFDGSHTVGNIFTNLPITSGSGSYEDASFIAQAYRQSIELQFTTIFDGGGFRPQT